MEKLSEINSGAGMTSSIAVESGSCKKSLWVWGPLPKTGSGNLSSRTAESYPGRIGECHVSKHDPYTCIRPIIYDLLKQGSSQFVEFSFCLWKASLFYFQVKFSSLSPYIVISEDSQKLEWLLVHWHPWLISHRHHASLKFESDWIKILYL